MCVEVTEMILVRATEIMVKERIMVKEMELQVLILFQIQVQVQI